MGKYIIFLMLFSTFPLIANALVYKKGTPPIRRFIFYLIAANLTNLLMFLSVHFDFKELTYPERYIYAGFEVIFLIWFAAKNVINKPFIKKYSDFICWFLGFLWGNLFILDSLSLYPFPMAQLESASNILVCLFLGISILSRTEVENTRERLPVTVLLFGAFFYLITTIIILGLLEGEVRYRMYFIHNAALVIAQLIYLSAFFLEYRRQKALIV